MHGRAWKLTGKLTTLGVVLADAGYCSADAITIGNLLCDLYISTRSGRKMRKDGSDPPRGPPPLDLSPVERIDWKMRTEKGREMYRKRGAVIEPVFGQMPRIQGAWEFRMRGLKNCQTEFTLHASVHNLRKIHTRLFN